MVVKIYCASCAAFALIAFLAALAVSVKTELSKTSAVYIIAPVTFYVGLVSTWVTFRKYHSSATDALETTSPWAHFLPIVLALEAVDFISAVIASLAGALGVATVATLFALIGCRVGRSAKESRP